MLRFCCNTVTKCAQMLVRKMPGEAFRAAFAELAISLFVFFLKVWDTVLNVA